MKKFVSILLMVAMLLCLGACSTSAEQPAVAGENEVVDGAGRILQIPEDRENTTIASVYAVAVPFVVALDLSDRVEAINVKSKFWTEAEESLAGAGTVGRGTVDLEALASYHPGVLIHRSNDNKTVEAVENLGIDVLCITVEDMEDIQETLTMMGKYFGEEDRAEEVIQWMNGKFEMIDEIVAQIPEEERVTALVLGGEQGRIAGDDMLQSWMIEKAGGICVADGTGKDHNWVDVGVEKVFEWNPDYIFCTSSTPLDYTVEGLMEDSAWSAMTAVQNGDIYVIPAKIDSWDLPGVSSTIGTMYLLYKMYPEYFTAEQLEEEIDEYYTFMFGKTFDPEYLGYQLEQ